MQGGCFKVKLCYYYSKFQVKYVEVVQYRQGNSFSSEGQTEVQFNSSWIFALFNKDICFTYYPTVQCIHIGHWTGLLNTKQYAVQPIYWTVILQDSSKQSIKYIIFFGNVVYCTGLLPVLLDGSKQSRQYSLLLDSWSGNLFYQTVTRQHVAKYLLDISHLQTVGSVVYFSRLSLDSSQKSIYQTAVRPRQEAVYSLLNCLQTVDSSYRKVLYLLDNIQCRFVLLDCDKTAAGKVFYQTLQYCRHHQIHSKQCSLFYQTSLDSSYSKVFYLTEVAY